MSASLVGSEMCIRDSGQSRGLHFPPPRALRPDVRRHSGLHSGETERPVSYTHLTLPTICSV
eukprot:10105140-Alexandrium_andersonii.AAC.1